MASASKKIALEARDIRASLANKPVLHGIDLALPAGRWTSVVGPNGAGKSTLLKVLAGLLPHSGEVRLLGQPLADLPGRSRAMQLSWLGQNESSGDDLTVLDVVMLGRLPHQPWLAAPQPGRPCGGAAGAAKHRRPGTGGSGRWASSRAASASVCCWREPWLCRRRCC